MISAVEQKGSGLRDYLHRCVLHSVFSLFIQGEDESMVSSLFQSYLHSLHSQHISTDHLLSDIKGALKSHTKTESSHDTCDKKCAACDMEMHSPPESEDSLFLSREHMSGTVQTQEIVLVEDSTETHDTNVEFGENLKTAQVQEGSSELGEEQVREGGVLVADEAVENVKRCAGEPEDMLAPDVSGDGQAELQAALRRLEEEERERKENLLKEQQEREVGMLKLTAYCK